MTNKLRVDRARFLAVATAFAGFASFQACTVVNDRDPEPNDGGAGMTNAGTKSDAGSESSGAAGGQGGADDGGMSNGGAANGGADGGATLGGAGQGGTAQGGAGGEGGEVGTCDSDLDDPLPCVGVSEACMPYCNAARLNLMSSISDRALTCLKADTTANCDAGYSCLADASATSCGEDEYAATCAAAEAEAACGPPGAGEPECTHLLAALKGQAKDDVIECLEGANCFSVYSCAEGFFFE